MTCWKGRVGGTKLDYLTGSRTARKTPLQMLRTRVETQAVLDLIGRLNDGVLA
jgi:hypothetical protein